MLIQLEREFHVGGDVRGLVGGAAVHERQRVGELVGQREAVPSAALVAPGGERRVIGLRRVERLLHIEDRCLVLLDVAKHAHVDFQQAVEHVLIHAHVAGEVAQVLVQDGSVVVQETKRDAIARVLASSHECHMVVLLESRLFNFALPVGVGSSVIEREPQAGDLFDVLLGVEHVQVLEHAREAETAIVTHSGAPRDPALGLHLDDARSASRAILCRLAGVFQDGETLNVGGADA